MTTPVPADAGNTPAETVTAPVEQSTPSPADMPQTAPPAQAAAEPTTGDDGGQPDFSAEISKLRKEAAKYRTQLRQTEEDNAAAKAIVEQMQAKQAESDDRWSKLVAAINPEADKPLTVEEVTAQFADERAQWDLKSTDYDSKLTAAQAQIRDLTIRAALPSIMSKAQADPGLTEAVLTASGALAKLDPTAETFAADLESAVSAAVEQNPRLKVTPVATRSGAPIPGRSGGDGQLTREDVQRMAKTDPEGLVKAQQEGRLRSLGIS